MQAAASRVQLDLEVPTVPGPGMGIYGCDYHSLAAIYALIGQARLHLLNGRPDAAEVGWAGLTRHCESLKG